MSEIVIISRARTHSGLAIGAVDLATRRPLRILPPGRDHQPHNASVKVGDVWHADYALRGTPRPFIEDADATLRSRMRVIDAGAHIARTLPAAEGLMDELFDGMLHWNAWHEGYVEPSTPPRFSMQLWRPATLLMRFASDTIDGAYVYWEPGTKRRLLWAGDSPAPDSIRPGTLVHVSLSRPLPGNGKHAVSRLQLSAVY